MEKEQPGSEEPPSAIALAPRPLSAISVAKEQPLNKPSRRTIHPVERLEMADV